MVGDRNGQMGFQHVSELAINSDWNPVVPMSRDGNYGANLMVSHANLGNPSYPIVSDNKLGLSGASQYMHYLSDTSVVEMLPKYPGFGGGGFCDNPNSYCLPGYADKGEIPSGVLTPAHALSKSVMTDNSAMGSVQSHEDPQVSEERSRVTSPDGKRKRGSGRNMQRNSSGEVSEVKDSDEKKQKVEESGSSDQSNKQTGQQTKDNCSAEEDSKGYIHVRARRGQATNSHSLAERVRREKINERMKLLQELVPGCSKITGKALMLDEIINYVQSLQQQVEFLSMKLANVNPELNFDIDQILSKDILHSRGIPGFNPVMNFAQLGAPVIANATSLYHPIPQGMWDGDLQTLHQMGLGFDVNPAVGNLGSNGTH